uniref:Forkhead box R1 n=1 Tax=Seriola lalandi dorsalis TaxID=1841481 RepID=A0A3B4WT19_SERLL
MTFQLKTTAHLFDLHCTVGLTDWDMDKELKLATTTDQFYHDDNLNDQYMVQRPPARASRRKDEFIFYDKTSVFAVDLKRLPWFFCPSDTFVKPNLWLMVNPNIVCPVQYGAALQTPCGPAGEIQTPAKTQHPPAAELHMCAPGEAPLQEDLLHSVQCECFFLDSRNRCKGRTTKARFIFGFLFQDTKAVKPGCWPRPPVNYCTLIALALKSSHAGSLKVQQIYNFIREHFPFFQTAPDGWKNTIRHNLCFNSSFRKTCNQLGRDGKRKSCFWHLTLDGQRRLDDEIRMLTGESLKRLERSMSHPGPAVLQE